MDYTLKKHVSNKSDYFISNTDKDGISSINKQSKKIIFLKDVCNRKIILNNIPLSNPFIKKLDLCNDFYEAYFRDQESHCKVIVRPAKEEHRFEKSCYFV